MIVRRVKNQLPFLAAIASLLLIWQIGAWLLPEYLLPGVPATLGRLVRSLTQGAFLESLQKSLVRLLLGYPISCLFGMLLGLLAGASRGFAVYLRGLIAILQSIPPITWVPFLVILFGFGNVPILIMIVIASFFPMALSVMNATEGVSRTHLELARVMGASRWQLITKVYLPETLPAFITGAQVAFGNAWRSLIAGEMVSGAGAGLGFAIRYSGDVADMQGVLVGILVIACIASFVDRVLLEQAKRRLLHYRYASGEANE